MFEFLRKIKDLHGEKSLISSANRLIKSRLWLQIIIGMFLGICLGFFLSPSGYAAIDSDLAYLIGDWLKLPGNIFLGLIKMIILPLIACSIVLGISSSGDPDYVRRIGLPVMIFFIVTTAIAVLLGFSLASFFKPGSYIDSALVKNIMHVGVDLPTQGTQMQISLNAIPQAIADILPSNPLEAGLQLQMLQIVILAIFAGVVMLNIPKDIAKPFLDLCLVGQVGSMKVVSWAMLLAPYAVFGLLCDITIKIGLDAIVGMSSYIMTVLAGLVSLLFVYLLIVAVMAQTSPLHFLKAIQEVQLLAFSTSSSAAVMPLSIQAAKEKLNVKPLLAEFVIPLGATVNMGGTALYQTVAAIFLTQVFDVQLSVPTLIILMLTIIGASVGAPSSPGVGVVILSSILHGVGVPASGIALIIGVDRILDMSRTVINVTGDLAACIVFNRLSIK